MIARIVDGSKFDEFKSMYGETLVTGLFIFDTGRSFFILHVHVYVQVLELIKYTQFF